MPFIILILAVLVGFLFFQWRAARHTFDSIGERLDRLERELNRRPPPSGVLAPIEPKAPSPARSKIPEPGELEQPGSIPAVLGAMRAKEAAPRMASSPPNVPPVIAQVPPLTPSRPPIGPEGPLPPLAPPAPPTARRPALNLEKFLGVKLFAWVGGLALFLGMAFFAKYSFDQGWVSPAIRIATGYLVGAGLLAAGLLLSRERQPVTVQTFCASGVLILYVNIFASHAYYHFFGTAPAFALMVLVTAAAFLLSVRLNAPFVAILGLLGGFLTPILLSTGVDRPLSLFGYLALLDLGLIAVALRKRWHYLVLLAAAATVMMQIGWIVKFFAAEKFPAAFSVFLGFTVLFMAAFCFAHRRQQLDKWISGPAVLMPAAGLGFIFYLLSYPYTELVQRPVLLFSFLFLLSLPFLAITWLREDLRLVQPAGAAAVFLLMALWTSRFLRLEFLNPALAFYLLFAILHSVFPIVLQRRRPETAVIWWAHFYPLLALLLILVPIFKLDDLSFLVWPVVLVINLLAIGLAILTASLVAILGVFFLTVVVTGFWILRLPAALPNVPFVLLVIGGFALLFLVALVFAARMIFSKLPVPDPGSPSTTSLPRARQAGPWPVLTPDKFRELASLAAMLPFLLLTLVVLRLRLDNPSPVFALAGLLLVLLLALVRFSGIDLLAAVALLSLILLEYSWHSLSFTPGYAGVAVGWYLGFSTAFLAFPFIFQSRFEKRVIPWVTSALALPLNFFLIYRSTTQAVPEFPWMGLLPLSLAIPSLLGLVRLVRTVPLGNPGRNTLLALFGGATLFFITLIFPIQFERQWITIAWALEGAALLWLFHRLPHPGLRVVGAALLVVSFVRLALNPLVFSSYGRSGRPILNWYLYAYGIVTICLIAGARLLVPPRHKLSGLNVPPILYSLATIMAFLLLNIEIADYFSGAGPRLIFNFSASFAQDMTYSLAWAVFAFAVLTIGFKINNSPTRYAGVALLIVTLVKLFLHDLWRLGGLYRIGSLIGLAVVLMLVSFIYQRFLSSTDRVSGSETADPRP